MRPALRIPPIRFLVLVGVLVAFPLTAGCVGFGGADDEGPADERIVKQRAEVTEGTGGIEGVVTDNAVAPVNGVTVRIVQLDQTATTADDGSFAFSRVPPGVYTVEATREGFVPGTESVAVRANAIATVDFLLVHLQSEQAYMVAMEQSGFLECGQQVGWNVTSTSGPLWEPVADAINDTTGRRLRDPGYFFLGIATCFVPNVVVENSTNDRFIHFFDIEPPIETLVYDGVWDSSGSAFGQMNAWLSIVMEVQQFSNDDDATFYEEDTRSPAYGRIDRDRFDRIRDYLSAECEAGDDDACLSPDDEGWPLQLRVFAAWQCVSETAGACAAFQQQFTHFMSAFYNAPAPEGYTALEEGST